MNKEDIDQFNFDSEMEADINYSEGWARGRSEMRAEIIKIIKSIPRANILDEYDTYFIERKKLLSKLREIDKE